MLDIMAGKMPDRMSEYVGMYVKICARVGITRSKVISRAPFCILSFLELVLGFYSFFPCVAVLRFLLFFLRSSPMDNYGHACAHFPQMAYSYSIPGIIEMQL
jgi:hypothetical protein